MLHVRHIDADLEIDCEYKQGGLVCPRKAIAELYTENDNRYLCQHHLDLAKEENEAKELEVEE